MCGIAGVMQFARSLDLGRLAATFDRALAHRGPDDRGVFQSAETLLVHRRLAIIDTSDGGHQPMSTDTGRHHLVYNGEAYNYRELRESLEAQGDRFETQSDTEVLLRLVARRGPCALADVRGMFALAVWDAAARTLTVARDRFGIKPLYFAHAPTHVAFASEVRTLVQSGLVDTTVDAAGVLSFMRWGHIPAPLTWMRGVQALDPGQWMRWHADGSHESGRFAQLRLEWSGGSDKVDEHALTQQVRRGLEESVAAHLVADVPVGVFLSGGVDSAVLTALARPRVRDLHTYTVVFDEDGFSEQHAARLTAQHFETTHHELRVDATMVARDFDTALAVMDLPTVDGFNTFAIAQAVAATGSKAVLSGIGGDELFGGYPSFQRLPRAAQWSRRLRGATPLLGWMAAQTRPRWQRPRWQQFSDANGAPAEMYRALRGFVMPAELSTLIGPAIHGDADAHSRAAAAESVLTLQSNGESLAGTAGRLETTVYLRSQLLRDADAMSMAHALEVRVPFVDAPLLQTVWPAIARDPRWVEAKSLFKRAVPELPSHLLGLPKRGFTLPFQQWIDRELREPVHSGLEFLAADGWIAADAPQRMLRQWQRGDVHWTRIWGLSVLGQFLHQRVRS